MSPAMGPPTTDSDSVDSAATDSVDALATDPGSIDSAATDSGPVDARAVSPVVGVVALVLVTALGAAAVGVTLASAPADPPPVADLRLAVDASEDRLVLRHAGGDELDVADLQVRVHVGGEPLTHQPPVPFFAARGFVSGPTGPFNPSGGSTWRAGQRATLRLATTNGPLPDSGDGVTVTVATDRAMIAELEAAAT